MRGAQAQGDLVYPRRRLPAGEMKHGPIALIDRDLPVIVIAPRDPWYEKMFSQIEQARARGGYVIALATDGDERTMSVAITRSGCPIVHGC